MELSLESLEVGVAALKAVTVVVLLALLVRWYLGRNKGPRAVGPAGENFPGGHYSFEVVSENIVRFQSVFICVTPRGKVRALEGGKTSFEAVVRHDFFGWQGLFALKTGYTVFIPFALRGSMFVTHEDAKGLLLAENVAREKLRAEGLIPKFFPH
jgi:hypothetical protein